MTSSPTIPSTRSTTHACGLSDVGKIREGNEDAWISDPRQGMFLVADGIGGHAGGEVASVIATTVAHRVLSQQQNIVTPSERLRRSFQAANREVQSAAASDIHLAGMGTTLVALLLAAGQAWLAHTGDSRCYLMRSQALVLLTTDHARANGALMHAIGLDEPVFLQTRVLSVHPGDMFLLCSDGLTNAISEAQISYRLRKRKPVSALCRDLVQDALDAGGPDNVTVVLVKT